MLIQASRAWLELCLLQHCEHGELGSPCMLQRSVSCLERRPCPAGKPWTHCSAPTGPGEICAVRTLRRNHLQS